MKKKLPCCIKCPKLLHTAGHQNAQHWSSTWVCYFCISKIARGVRPFLAITQFCSAPFLMGGADSMVWLHHGAGCGFGPLPLTVTLNEKESTGCLITTEISSLDHSNFKANLVKRSISADKLALMTLVFIIVISRRYQVAELSQLKAEQLGSGLGLVASVHQNWWKGHKGIQMGGFG